MSKKTWDLDFNCPQYVDFAQDLDLSLTKDEVFFDCGDYSAPMQNEACESKVIDSDTIDVTNESTVKAEGMTAVNVSKTSEGFLVKVQPKVMAGLEAIGNDPKANIIHTEYMEKSLLPKLAWNFTPKIAETETGYSLKITQSKSIADLRQFGIKPASTKRLRKRSSSLNDLRHVIKKTIPGTPMCYKRSITKPRKVIKSTEQIELEEIARLQKQMKQHLRQNELSLKRLHLKPQEAIPKSTWSRSLKPNHEKGVNPPAERMACPTKEKRINLPELCKEDLKTRALKADEFVKLHKQRITESVKMEGPKMQQKPALNKKIGFHSGLRFRETIKKTTQVKPFNFCTRPRELKMQATCVTSASEVKVNQTIAGKENVPLKDVKPFFMKSNKGKLNCENVDAPKKLSEKREFARQRGLSENIARD